MPSGVYKRTEDFCRKDFCRKSKILKKRWQNSGYRVKMSKMISIAAKKRWQDPEFRAKMEKIRQNPEYREKIGKMPKEYIPWNKGKHHSVETRRKMSKAHKSAKAYNWKGRSKKRYEHGNSTMEYKEWRMAVFQRDNFTCQCCGARSKAGKPVYLEAHHLKGWAEYPALRFVVKNGVTLCKECHKLAHKIKRKYV